LQQRPKHVPRDIGPRLCRKVRCAAYGRNDQLTGGEIICIRLTAYTRKEGVQLPAQPEIQSQIACDPIVVLAIECPKIAAVAIDLKRRGAQHTARITKQEIGEGIARIACTEWILGILTVKGRRSLRALPVVKSMSLMRKLRAELNKMFAVGPCQ